MNQGRVVAILTLPDRVLLESVGQLAELPNLQKVEVVFGSRSWSKKEEKEALLVESFGDKTVAALTRLLPVLILVTGLASIGSFLAYRKLK